MKNNLFNLDSIKKYTNNFIVTSEKQDKIKRYIERVQNNEFKGETKGYPAFLKFLEDILGYEEDKHISFDDNVDVGSDRVEFALKDNDGKFMVIELKGQNADLDKPQNRANDKHSPVEQAFGYAQHSSKKSGLVEWILVSNYKEFRLYNYNKRLGEYISFNVEDLLNDDIFKTFMFAFSKESHVDLKAINDVVNENYIEKTQLANNFYKLFNETRLMIYKELNELHGMDKNDAISNAQKILDRVIFISFASSRELLPENIARNILLDRIKSGNIRDHEIWRDLNYLFKDVNEGNIDRNISKYNGGLFKDDLTDIELKDIINDKNFFKDVYQKWNFKEFEERLEKEIKPSILKRINPIYINLLIISYFDFSEENNENIEHKLDIEILGHIFENSIGDLEELKEDSKGRRKKNGIFYTPDYITDYICKNTIIPYLSASGNINTVEGLLDEYSTGHEIEKLDQKLKKIRIVDPACGSGAFLNKATDIILDIHKGIFEIKKGYKTSTSMKVGTGKSRRTENVQHMDIGVYVFDALSKRREILLDNIYGVDLNSESVEITKLSLFLKVCEQDKTLPAIDKNILCGNSIIDDPKFTDKPFNWKKEFKEIFQSGGFDIVIGNPPYVRQERIKEIKPYLKDNYNVYTGVADLYVYFFEKGLNILKQGGMFSFISSNKFTRAIYGKPLRKFILKNEFKKYVDYVGTKVFQDVTVDPCVIVIKKGHLDENNVLVDDKFEIPQKTLNEKSWNFVSQEITDLRNKIDTKGTKIKTIDDLRIYRGVTTGYMKAFVIDKPTKNAMTSKDSKYSKVIKPFVRGKDINKWKINYKDLYLIFTRRGIKIEEFPLIKTYLNKFRGQLTPKNKEEKIGRKPGNYEWYEIQDTIDYYKEFEEKKIIWAELTPSPRFTIDKSGLFCETSIFIMSKPKNYNLKYICALLNSKLLFFQFKGISSTLGETGIRYKKVFVEQLPIYPATPEGQKPFIEKADKMLKLNKDLTKEIIGFKGWLQREPYNIDKFSLKLGKYYKLSFEEFLTELNKKKVDTKQRKVQELLRNEFEESINVINPLLQQIKETDSEIDKMVYDLYGLTNEEIKIIEDSLDKN
jgi:hypothetical protein